MYFSHRPFFSHFSSFAYTSHVTVFLRFLNLLHFLTASLKSVFRSPTPRPCLWPFTSHCKSSPCFVSLSVVTPRLEFLSPPCFYLGLSPCDSILNCCLLLVCFTVLGAGLTVLCVLGNTLHLTHSVKGSTWHAVGAQLKCTPFMYPPEPAMVLSPCVYECV